MEKWKLRLKALYDAYGKVAIGVYVAIALAVVLGAAAALQLGWHPESLAGSASVWAGAYVFYKLTMLPRIVLAVVLTPFVAKLLGRKPSPLV